MTIGIPAGSLLTITTGEYSDYTVHGVFRAIKDLDVDALKAEWLLVHPNQAENYKFSAVAFLAHIANLLEPVECFEWHLADYGNITEMFVSRLDK